MLKSVVVSSVHRPVVSIVDSIQLWSAQWSWSQHGFLTCILFIAAVSSYDSYLVVHYRDMILNDERNPICEILIRKDPNSLSWFLAGKLIGNLAVICSLEALRRFRYVRVMTVAVSVAMFQFCLLTFLTLSDPLTGFLHFDGLFSHDPEDVATACNTLVVHVVGLIIAATVALGTVKWFSIRNSQPEKAIAT